MGNPVRLIASPGQRNDIAFAHDLVDGFEAGATLADKGYDADHFCEAIAQTGAEVVIPPKRNRKAQRDYDVELYKERNIIERFPIRQIARQFHGLRQTRRNRHLPQIVKSSLRPSADIVLVWNCYCVSSWHRRDLSGIARPIGEASQPSASAAQKSDNGQAKAYSRAQQCFSP